MQLTQLSDQEQQRADDLRWALRSQDVRQHSGKLVAIYKRRILGVGVDRTVLIEHAATAAQCHAQDIVVVVVPSADLAELPK